MNRKEAIEIAKSLKINIKEEAINSILEKYDFFMERITLLKAIDTEGIEPMHRVDETETFFLREDVEGKTLPVDVIIENAPESQGNFVTIAKVVK